MLRRRALPAALAISCLAAACGGGSSAPPPSFPPTPVKLEPARAVPVEDATEYVATLKSLHSTAIQPQIDGQITQIFVKSGDRVKQGAALMQIDPRRQQAAVSGQEAERTARQVAVQFAKQQAQRAHELYSAGAISKQEMEQADTNQQSAEAQLNSLAAQVQQQEVQLRYFTVTAPTAGEVGDVPVRVGNQVTPQTVLTTIDQNETLEVNASVPIERAIVAAQRPADPDSLERRLDAARGFGDQLHLAARGRPAAVDSGERRGPESERGAQFRASQYVRARIVWNTKDGLVVPVTAVLRVSGQVFAFVAEQAGGKLLAKQRAITVGPIVGENYPVLTGIKAGERIVVSGAQKLADGAPIQAAP